MQAFSREQVELIAARSRAIGDGTRIRILTVLAKSEQTVGQIADAVGTQPSTASKHLQVLFRAGLVQRRRAAAAVIYRITSPDLPMWLRYLSRRAIAKSVSARTGSEQRTTSAAETPRRRRS